MSGMINAYIFIIQTTIISFASLMALSFGSAALVAFICMQCLLANIFVLKQISLFGLNATAADGFSIGATIGLNLLQEYYGKAIARKTISINFFLLAFYALISQIHLWYTPSAFDTTQSHFITLLSIMPRIVMASFTAFFVSQWIDYMLYGWLRTIWNSRWLVVRNYSSTLVSQLVDTILFSLLGLYGLVESVSHIIIVSYTVKVIAVLCAVPFVTLSKKFYSSCN
jgi:queuosine precursor transporter